MLRDRRKNIGLLCVLGAVLAIATLVVCAIAQRPAPWLVKIKREYSGLDIVLTKNYPRLPSPWKERLYEIEQKKYKESKWTDEDLSEMLKILRRGYSKSIGEKNRTTDERGEQELWLEAFISIAARFDFGAPMPENAKELWQNFLIQELGSEMPERRISAAVHLINSKDIEDPGIRKSVEKLLNDPDPKVAEDAEFKLNQYDEMKERKPRHSK